PRGCTGAGAGTGWSRRRGGWGGGPARPRSPSPAGPREEGERRDLRDARRDHLHPRAGRPVLAAEEAERDRVPERRGDHRAGDPAGLLARRPDRGAALGPPRVREPEADDLAVD